jgi:hypothetical protein
LTPADTPFKATCDHAEEGVNDDEVRDAGAAAPHRLAPAGLPGERRIRPGRRGRILECNRSKISRIETGQRGIHPEELHELLAEYGARPAVVEALAALARPQRNGNGWWTEYASVLPEPYLEFAATEATASAIMTYAPAQVPELLQTPAYASTAAAVDASKPEEREAALAAAVLPAQLSHLAELAKHCEHVTIRLLPFTSGLSPAGSTGGFSVLQFGPAKALGIVYAPGPDGASFPPTRMPRPDTCGRSITCAHSRSARKPPPASSSNSRESAGRSSLHHRWFGNRMVPAFPSGALSWLSMRSTKCRYAARATWSASMAAAWSSGMLTVLKVS